MVTTNHSLRAVIFDYGRVLSLPPSDADWEALAAATDMPVDQLHHRYWEFRDAYDRKVVSAAKYWAQVAGRELAENELIELIAMDDAQWTRVNDDMLHLARQLKEAGVKIAILSNMQTDMLKVMRAKFDWLGEFDVQMYSCEIGMVKPEREIYLDCSRRLGVEPAQALFLDDKDKNVTGAEKAGMHAMIFDGEMSVLEKKLTELGVKLDS
jgi:putative hydrolase of the HAD superfamily